MDSKTVFYRRMARTSWILPLVCIGMMSLGRSVLSNSSSSIAWLISGGVYLLLLCCGIVAGIIACIGLKKHESKATLASGFVGLALNVSILALIFIIAVPAFNKYRNAARQKTNLAVMQKLARQTNLQLPKMIDDKTRLDRLIVLDPKHIKYHVTIVSSEKRDIDVERFISMMKPHLNNIYDTNPQFKAFRENGIGILYEYYDKKGILFASIHADEQSSTP